MESVFEPIYEILYESVEEDLNTEGASIPAEAVQDRDGNYIRDRFGNYIVNEPR